MNKTKLTTGIYTDQDIEQTTTKRYSSAPKWWKENRENMKEQHMALEVKSKFWQSHWHCISFGPRDSRGKPERWQVTLIKLSICL